MQTVGAPSKNTLTEYLGANDAILWGGGLAIGVIFRLRHIPLKWTSFTNVRRNLSTNCIRTIGCQFDSNSSADLTTTACNDYSFPVRFKISAFPKYLAFVV